MALTEVTVNFGVQGETGVRGELLTILHHYTNRVCEGNRKWLHHRATPTQEMVIPSQGHTHPEMVTSQGHTHLGNGHITGPHPPRKCSHHRATPTWEMVTSQGHTYPEHNQISPTSAAKQFNFHRLFWGGGDNV